MPDLRHSITIAAPAEAVFQLVAAPEGLARWWAADVEVHAANPLTVELGFFNRATVYRLERAEARPGTRVTWLCTTGKEWAGTRLEFDLLASGVKTALRFAHAGWEAETPYFVDCNTTWGGLLFRLRAAAEGRNPGPLFSNEGLAG
jgi:uncharacterized protein YndB with AHSA1/START domain